MSKNSKILLIDDERTLLLNLKQILEFEDFDVVTASNGLEALGVYEKEIPDLIICDIMMPDMDGYGFIQELRSKNFLNAPFIFLTAKTEYDDLRAGMNFGADDYLVKPIKSFQLIESVNIRLQRKREINKPLQSELHRTRQGFDLITNKDSLTNINDILNNLKEIKAKVADMDTKTLQGYLEHIESSAERLLGLFKKVKQWHKYRNNNDLFRATNSGVQIKDIIEQSAQNIATKYNRQKDILCNVEDINAQVKISTDILEILLYEILDNAFKFTTEGELVKVNTTVDDKNCIITISDNGKTSNANTLNNINPIDYSFKLENEGSGLGLVITTMAIKSINGKLTFTDNEPFGITVTVQLPIHQNNAFDEALAANFKRMFMLQ